VDALNNALAKSTRAGDVDPVIYVPTYDGRDALLPSACCHIMVGDIRIVCPVSGDGEFSDQLVGVFMYRMKANRMMATQGTRYLRSHFYRALWRYYKSISGPSLLPL
jgi:hypothetical protein